MKPLILGIESSCDDTSASVLRGNKILSNIVANQEIHRLYGGVVPELASRSHQQNIVPVVSQALAQANIQKKEIDAIAFTRGPGLLGSLLVGTSFAKSMSMALGIPLIEVNHMQAHILAHFIEDANDSPLEFPFICLTVSGGHTQLVKVNGYFEMEVLGETLDDAAGEAFDKLGKLLGLDYPAGPIIDQYAKQGNPNAFEFPLPKLEGLQFSFSGIKTSVLYFIQKQEQMNKDFIQENIYDLCASIQKTIIEALLVKVKQCVNQTGIPRIAIAGGVSANSELRNKLQELAKENNYQVFIPKFEYTTDNAAMIAMVGSLKFQQNQFTDLETYATSRLKL